MVDAFIRRLRAMGGDEKPRLEKALQAAAEPALVRSALELSADQRAAIQTAINETFSADIHIRFEVASDLVSGIELSTNGQKVAWSFAEYLASIQKATDEILKTQDTPGTNDTSDRQAPELETQTQ